ncbi:MULTISPECIES: LptA/OstA family protein [Sphingomonas]|jgi:lipopolysaccharide export system protein LptA|uniref:OstA family protein n=1 Tax=Sphingomonas ginsenosidimutans TaxID=862134 RepID=A0A2A4HX74_9SPHN|nr:MULTISPECIES: LptA/OstA family protein [Sphingomonas]MBY0302997.1 LptA/OstA family protein [Sphingomonas ginsenosidimutans]PCG09136.1 OstA family protein [Sphingomonas ginsenosidimutans]
MRHAAFLILALAAAAPATAQTRHDTNAPVNVAADHIELQDRANRAVFAGNVQVQQAEMTLRAQRIVLTYTGQIEGGNPQISRMDASGGVTVIRPDQTARSQFAVYDLNRRIITMLGAVRLTQGGSTVNGGRLTINLDSGRAVIDGSSVAGGGSGANGVQPAPNGRVTGTFAVPKRNN